MTSVRRTIEEPASKRPVSHDVDVLVAGSGPAGFAAALAAAREGASTLLVERYGYLGGMMTGSLVVAVLGVGDGRGNIKARGVTGDLRRRLEQHGGAKGMNRDGDYRIDAEVFKWQAAEMLREAGADILLHTLACDPVMEDRRVTGVFTESKNGRQAVRAKVVVDASADADIAFRAGCTCEDETHDVSLIVKVTGVDDAEVERFRKDDPGRFRAVIGEAERRNGGAMPGRTRLLKGISVSDAESLTDAETRLRGDCFGALAYLRDNLPGYENARVAQTLPQIGVRLGRRVRGQRSLTDQEIRESRHFDDGIARLGAYLLGYELYGVPELDYDVPYRCLVPAQTDGLLVAGRCVSCDYLAGNTLRLIVPCFATGQAAGAAAALAARYGVQPCDVPVPELRSALLAQGVNLG